MAIIASLLYFYFWIRSIARKVDRRGLDVRLEELESSVRETTRWLETASGQIREDLENRMSALKNMLDHAENTDESSRPRADRTASQTIETFRVSTDLEPPSESMPAASGEPATFGTGIANQQSIDITPTSAPSSTPLAAGLESDLEPEPYAELPPADPVAGLWPDPSDPFLDPTAEPLPGDGEGVPSTPETVEPLSIVPDEPPPMAAPPAPPGPADRRAQILQLADQGIEPSEIARQLDTSRAEVELIVSFRRPH